MIISCCCIEVHSQNNIVCLSIIIEHRTVDLLLYSTTIKIPPYCLLPTLPSLVITFFLILYQKQHSSTLLIISIFQRSKLWSWTLPKLFQYSFEGFLVGLTLHVTNPFFRQQFVFR